MRDLLIYKLNNWSNTLPGLLVFPCEHMYFLNKINVSFFAKSIQSPYFLKNLVRNKVYVYSLAVRHFWAQYPHTQAV